MENLGKKMYEVSNMLTDETIKNASNEELMGYLFLVKKMQKKLEKACKMQNE